MTREEHAPEASAGSTSSPVTAPNHGLPVADPCLSYWQQTTRSFPFLNANAEHPVPSSTCKYVVIGSGLAGALTAYELIHAAGVPAADVVILEAREAASGASGRNAGHVRPDAFRGFQVYRRLHGTRQALAIIANERDVLRHVDAFVAAHAVPCDFHLATTLDVCLTPDFAAFNARSLDEYRDAGGDVSHVAVYHGDDARRRTGIPHAVSAYEWPAGSSHPAKLAQWLLAQSIHAGAALFTHCPATAVVPSAAVPGHWDIATPRGTLTAETVVHCTNAFAGHLVPQLSPYLTPNRAQAHLLVPPPALSAAHALSSTMSLRHSLHHFYSVMQRPADGLIVLGASRKSPNLSPDALASVFTTDDTSYNDEVRADALANFAKCFPSCDEANLRHGEGLQHTWTGILGMTTDSVPFVGKLDDLPGQYVCAGFNGHGMARIFNCAPGVVKLIQGEPWAATGLPECFEATQARLDRLAKGDMESVF